VKNNSSDSPLFKPAQHERSLKQLGDLVETLSRCVSGFQKLNFILRSSKQLEGAAENLKRSLLLHQLNR
jgi:hypothetical protein